MIPVFSPNRLLFMVIMISGSFKDQNITYKGSLQDSGEVWYNEEYD